MVIELGPPTSESSTGISKFYNPTDSEHKLHKTRIENWLSIGFELEFPSGEPTVITTTPYSTYSMMRSLKVLYSHLQGLVLNLKTFTFTVQVPSKSTPSILASNSNKNKPPFALSSANTPNTLNYATTLAAV